MRESVARYRIVSALGRGSMGFVYLAEDPLLNRQVAIKMVDLVDAGAKPEEARERLLRDAKAVANLSHPNIVNVHDVIQEGESAFIVMEYIEGDTLAACLQKLPLPELAFSVQVLRQMAAALDYAHGKGVIHRDVKPGNVMLGPSGIAKIVDFGIARINNTQTSTPAGFVAGTAAYMAPEQFTGSPVDGRADQYSLAAVGYEMMTGGTLFGEQALPVLAYKAVHEMPPAANTRNAAIPPSANMALIKALAKSPAARYATCSEFVDTLANAISGMANPPLPAAQAPVSDMRSASREWLIGLAVLILAAGGLALWRPWQRPPQTVAVTTTAPPVAPAVETIALPITQPKVEPTTANKAAIPNPAHKLPAVKTEPDKETLPPSTTPAKLPEPDASSKTGVAVAEILRRGQEQLKARDYQAAIQSFSSVISQQPKRAQAYYGRAEAHRFLLENEAAIKDYDEAIRFRPEDPYPHIGRGVCFARLSRDDEAFADFNRALEIKADLPAALNARGGILLRRRQFENAIRDFTAALAINPHFAQAYRNRAAAKQALGDKAGARADRKAADNAKNGEP
jgi:serine/threonine protein kinase/Tfp pilus assembly protein PilF